MILEYGISYIWTYKMDIPPFRFNLAGYSILWIHFWEDSAPSSDLPL